ncbi:hypothetical protein [Tessaracoccus sp. OH4464_COT-324]|uniref:hypothetical protein n=1 Tax=Tessaracoccus sp. OH4464_COT-324 TaxID=2491059 RepID=UPI000F642474|nr:hypothetical protein [Tessaracoccus sp. OH4464_COT-324]RRD46729.1 hypothetical protein EII42_05750 [Tessaracoccus sp. OH4464_COT-324]
MTNPQFAQDPEAFLALLDEQIKELVQLSARVGAIEAPGSATDPTGSVTVTFLEGGRLDTITVANGWEKNIPADELAGVIAQTLTAAWEDDSSGGEKSDEEVAEAVRREQEEVRRLLDMGPIGGGLRRPTVPSLAGQPSDFSEEQEYEPDRAYSANRAVWIEHVRGTVLGVELRQSWPEGKAGSTITESLNEAIDALAAVTAE